MLPSLRLLADTDQPGSADRPRTYTSSVWLGPFELKMYETFTLSSRADAERSSDLVLRQVAAWLRPFCRVEWR